MATLGQTPSIFHQIHLSSPSSSQRFHVAVIPVPTFQMNKLKSERLYNCQGFHRGLRKKLVSASGLSESQAHFSLLCYRELTFQPMEVLHQNVPEMDRARPRTGSRGAQDRDGKKPTSVKSPECGRLLTSITSSNPLPPSWRSPLFRLRGKCLTQGHDWQRAELDSTPCTQPWFCASPLAANGDHPNLGPQLQVHRRRQGKAAPGPQAVLPKEGPGSQQKGP